MAKKSKYQSSLEEAQWERRLILHNGKPPEWVIGYFRWCHHRRIPCLKIDIRKGVYLIDLICGNSYPKKFDEIATKGLQHVLDRYHVTTAIIEGNTVSVNVSTCPLAFDFARELFRVAVEFGLRTCGIDDGVVRVIVSEDQARNRWLATQKDKCLTKIQNCTLLLDDGRRFEIGFHSNKPMEADWLRAEFLSRPQRWTERNPDGSFKLKFLAKFLGK